MGNVTVTEVCVKALGPGHAPGMPVRRPDSSVVSLTSNDFAWSQS